MSKRLVLSGLMGLMGAPMLFNRAAPLGLLLVLIAASLAGLPWIHRAAAGSSDRRRRGAEPSYR